MNLGRRETALLCELLLRGPQTIGELKDRAGRMHRFNDLDEVERCVASMDFVRQLPKQPGTKERRWAQVLSGEPQISATAASSVSDSPRGDRVGQLEAEVASLHQRLDDLERQWAEFKRQFD
jgi:uncharacterized protein YceH (UPF0502 family)